MRFCLLATFTYNIAHISSRENKPDFRASPLYTSGGHHEHYYIPWSCVFWSRAPGQIVQSYPLKECCVYVVKRVFSSSDSGLGLFPLIYHPPSWMRAFTWEHKNKGIFGINLLTWWRRAQVSRMLSRFQVGLGAQNWGPHSLLLNVVMKDCHPVLWFALGQAWCDTLHLISTPSRPLNNPPTPKALVNWINLSEIFVPRRYLSFFESSLLSAFRDTFTQSWNVSLLSLLHHTKL